MTNINYCHKVFVSKKIGKLSKFKNSISIATVQRNETIAIDTPYGNGIYSILIKTMILFP